jgi:putative ABC transport system permease protein
MMFVAIKMLIGDRLKYLALVSGVAFAALLITQQSSIFTGFALRTGAWIHDVSVADLWVSDPQMEFSDDLKPMSETQLQRIRGTEGVAWAVPMTKNYLKVRLADGSVFQSRVIGLDDGTLVGGPPIMVTGRLEDLRQDKAVIVREEDLTSGLLPRRGGKPLKVGDRFDINDNEAVIVGTFRSTTEFFWEPVVYTLRTRALSWAPKERKQLTYVLAKCQPGFVPGEVADRINRTMPLLARTNDEFRTETMWWVLKKTGILVNFGITIGLGVVIGLLVASQTFYTFVLDNVRFFAALRAMGTSTGTVARMLVSQVVTVGMMGYGIGIGLACVTGIAFSSVGLAFQMTWQIPVIGAISVLGCCAIAGLLGMWRVLSMEPAVVFKG